MDLYPIQVTDGEDIDCATEMSRAERLLSYSLLALITSKPLASTSTTTLEEEAEIPPLMDKGKGTMNADGAWCWREGCIGEFKRRRGDIARQMTKKLSRLPQTDKIYAEVRRCSPKCSGHLRRPRSKDSTYHTRSIEGRLTSTYHICGTPFRSQLRESERAIDGPLSLLSILTFPPWLGTTKP